MEDHQSNESPSDPPSATRKAHSLSPSPSPYSTWRTAAHLYLPLVAVAVFMLFGAPFATKEANFLFVAFSAIPVNWFASLLYPTDRPEPTPTQAVRFSRKKDHYRAMILFTYRWLFGAPFNLKYFIADFLISYGVGSIIGERPAGTKQRRSEFGVHLLWVAGSAALPLVAPAFLTLWLDLIDRAICRAAYIALVDDIVGMLTRPNLKSWKGKIRLVLVQAFVIVFMCFMLLCWVKDLETAVQSHRESNAALAALGSEQVSDDTEGVLEDDGDRFLMS